MQKKPNRLLAVLPLLLSGLINCQAYAAENVKNPAATNQTQAASANPGHTKAASENAAAPASSEAAKAKHQPQATATNAETVAGPTELPSLSIVETLLSGLLAAVFFLVLFRGNLFKHH